MQNSRFKVITNLSVDYYEPGIPIEIAKGAILLDIKNNQLLLQLKLRNLSDKVINLVELEVECFDLKGNKIVEENVVSYTYKGFEAVPKKLFGDRQAIHLASNKTKRINVVFKKIMFVGSGSLNFLQTKKLYIPNTVKITALNDGLKKEIKSLALNSEFAEVVNLPKEVDEKIWVCCCGRVNEKQEVCIRCGLSKVTQLQELNLEKLKDQLEEKKALLVEEYQLKKQEEEKGIKRRKVLKRNIAITIGVSICTMIGISGSYLLEEKYFYSMEAYLDEQYAQAYQGFNKIKYYKDSHMIAAHLYEELFLDGTLPIEIEGKWGFINETGAYAINPIYDSIERTDDDLYRIELAGKLGILGSDLNYKIVPVYDTIERFDGHLYKVAQDGKVGVLNNNFEFVKALMYDGIEEIEVATAPLEPLYEVALAGYVGVADKNLIDIIEPIYDTIECVTSELLEVEKDGKKGIVSIDGTIVLEPVYNRIDYIGENFYIGKREDEEVIINKEGKIIYSGQDFEYIQIENFIAIRNDDKWTINDIEGQLAVKSLFDSIRYDNIGKILVEYTDSTMEQPEGETFYRVGKYSEEDIALPNNYYILFIEEDGDLYRANNDKIILRSMIYAFEYDQLPIEWKELINKNELI